jgi:hypothetical protein
MERLNLREQAGGLYVRAQVVGILGLVASVLLGYFAKDDFRTFFHSYLIGFMFFLAIALGGLFFVLLQHATKAGWSVNVRRIAEWFAATLPLMAVLSVPILAAVLMGHGALYPWAVDGWSVDKGFKGWWLSRGFFTGRAVFNFVVWSIIGVWYWKQSVKQDETGDIAITLRMQYRAPVCLILFGLTVTVMAWDWIMSLDPVWYSTIFGVYYFAGSTLAIFSTLILTVRFLQSRGLLVKSVTTEHFHDLGKFLFGFTFFWGYIAFSQFMLQWYGNIPDETGWFMRHGASTVAGAPHDFSPVLLILLFGHFLIPFPGLLSRHVKRNPASLSFWAVWMLAFCWFDIFWLVAPQYDGALHLGPLDLGEHLAVLLGIGGIFVAFVLRKASHDSIRAMRDPRLADSLAFQNY